MKFTEILEELRKGEKVTREKWEECETEWYKYIKLEHGEVIAYLKDDHSLLLLDDIGEDKVVERTKCMFELTDFTAEDWKIYEEPNKNWQPEEGGTYFYINSLGVVESKTYDSDTYIDNARLKFTNIFRTEEEANIMARKLQIIVKLRKLSNIKFNENQKSKWCIFYDFDKNELTCIYNRCCKHSPFEVYFASEEDCQKAIETIGEDNLKKYYFDVED